MRTNNFKATLTSALRVLSILPFAAVVAFGQQTVNLTAGSTNLTMPDGTVVPMWGYSCTVTGTAAATGAQTCVKSNPTAAGWSPVVITVPTGQPLTISLTNNLSFTTGSGTNNVPTSLMIVGQLGGGLGTTATSTPSPDHTNAQQVTWPIPAPGAAGTPPQQGNRVQSFSTEVAAGATTALTWATLRPGTYLIESGTHPSIQGPMGLYGILVVTTRATTTKAGVAYPGANAALSLTYNAEVPILLSEIDPLQNKSVQTAVTTAGFSETKVWSGQPGGCGNPSSPVGTVNTCYPPAVNYTPLYYLINGVAFDKTQAVAPAISPSLFPTSPATATAGTGKVLVRFVNAGLRMHVPSIVGSQTGTAVAPALPPAGFSLIAEDGNVLPGVARVQSEVFLAAGKTYDVMINAPAAGSTALPVFDRELSLSGNATARDAGMLAYIGINGSGLPAAGALAAAVARADTYNSVITGKTLTVSDPSKGVIANDTNVYGVKVIGTVAGLTLNTDGTFTYTGAPTSFTYCGNGATTGPSCALVALNAAPIETGGITMAPMTFNSNVASYLSIRAPGVLAVDKDAAGYPLTVSGATLTAPLTMALTGTTGGTVSVDVNGGFNATVPLCTALAGCSYTFAYSAQNSQGTVSSTAATVTVNFPPATGLAVTVKDPSGSTISDYRWIIEEDRTFYINPACTTNPPAAGCPTSGSGIVPTFGTNFHTSYMPLVATGCVGTLACEAGQSVAGVPSVCDIGNGICRPGAQQTAVNPSQVHLDPTRRYYISVLPGDAAFPFESGNATPGHGMGGAQVACVPVAPAVTCTATGTFPAVTVLTQPTPFPPSKLSVFVYEDDFPLNGEQDGGGGTGDTLSPDEPGLGHFNITLFDDAGGSGDATGQMTYDMFNMPLTNSLAGTIDPLTNQDACPISPAASANGDTITGTIVVCPKYEADGTSLSPLAGQAVVANLMPGRYGVVATPGADRIAKGEEWLQTNTLDGQKAHDSFLRIGEPSFFQEFGPAGFHVSIGFANPQIINSRLAGVCNGSDLNLPGGYTCTSTVTGTVTTERMSRTPDERLFSSGDNSSFSFTQCYVSFGDPDGEDFAFTKCDANGNFTLSGLPSGDWRVTVFDQWNDMLVDGLSSPVRLAAGATANMGQIAMNQWQANIYTRTFFDKNHDGVSNVDNQGNPTEPGLSLVATNIRFRDGSYSNFNSTDLAGNAGFNEVFPLFSWYVIETDTTRFKSTGTHVVYDAGGPSDGTACGGTTGIVCGNSNIGHFMANTAEQVPLPAALRLPGARYCANADCPAGDTAGGSTGRVDPPLAHPYGTTYGWQGFSGQNSFIEFGKMPYAVGETGGIHGEVTYASTRPFDDPQLLIHTSWTPNVPGVTINLYQEGTAPDGSTSLHLVDTTTTSSFDDWAQGFRADNGNPNISCPGQMAAPTATTPGDLFFFSLFNQPNYLDTYNNQHNGTPLHTLPNNSQFKCYDGMHTWNQIQPAPYDGMYTFPSVTATNPTTGIPAGTNCHMKTTPEPWGCIPNPTVATPPVTAANYDPFRAGTPMLPAGKYVVEMIVPPGYELVKEEDKNILIGDNYIAPAIQEFGGLGSIFILPDQATVASSYNAKNAQNATTDMGRKLTLSSHEGDTGSVETFWPCVGASRIVPDYISLFPGSHEVAPFAGATRNLCDRKEVILDDQTSSLAKFWVFTSTHAAAHFTGVITDDFTSEFDPFSPQFGEKFSPPDLPIAIKDWTGTEISRVYTDHWGAYNGLTYSTWEVNPPNPTGYAPTMMVTCMNDPGTGPTPDPLYNPSYSQFCYEIPFMPGQTQYMDTPVTPTSAFAGAGYNNPDCAYPANTPAIKEVDSSDGIGPWVSAAGTGHTLTITALGDVFVNNNAYTGPQATTPPYNQKTISRHYGFGATPGTVALVDAAGVRHPLTGVSWGDLSITGTVPTGLPNCGIQQQVQYAGSAATSQQCGQLLIIAANLQQSVDTVTVTIGGKAPTHIAASGSIQAAIDAAKPGDLLIVDPTCTAAGVAAGCSTAALHAATPTQTAAQSTHQEILLMWKPVRLQGVGAVSSIINANTHPAGKMDAWRVKVNCLFGLGISGTPSTWDHNCGAAWTAWNAATSNPQIDRLPLEAVVGWDATLNGNLAELLQEPTLMGALEGAAITVLSKGVAFPPGSDPFSSGGAATPGIFPVGTLLLNNSTSTTRGCGANTASAHNPFPSSFWCNPSRIDGLGITNSSQGGGGIFVHAWGHNLEISNNRVQNNSGTLTGGISVGQGEFPPSYTQGGTNADPGSCQTTAAVSGTGAQLPYCLDMHVNVHNNAVTDNASTGDELFSATPAGAGGISFCTGTDFYKFQNNWVCGNLSTGDGGGFGQLGFVYGGDIEHNAFLFNQSTNPTIPTNGGGLLIMGAPDADPPCSTLDQDCVGATNAVGPSDGIGPGLVINANLIMGNAAESGSGGGIRLQNINGSEVVLFPRTPAQWYHPVITNNIIVNNVAGWDGAGISLVDALNTDIINNTIMANDTTASSGVLFNTLGAPIASSEGPCAIDPATGLPPNPCVTASTPQPAGLVSIQNSAVLVGNLPSSGPGAVTVTCPTNHFAPGTSATNGTCRSISYPLLQNNVFFQNRTFHIGVGTLGAGLLNQQNIVTLFNGNTTTPAANQTITGQCPAGASYWDIGVRGDTGPTNHAVAAWKLDPTYSVLTDITGYTTQGTGATASHNTATSPAVVSQYCNGSRIPPEYAVAVGSAGGAGWQVPPGISDATVPNPVFSLTPAATVDEGNNWINISWGPLAETNPVTGVTLGNYAPTATSSVINLIPSTAGTNYSNAPGLDFFGNSRKTNNAVDAGAVEFGGATAALPTLTSIAPNSGARSSGVPVTLTGTNLGGTSAITVSGTGITVSLLTNVNATTVTATFTISATAALGARTVSVTTPGGTSNTVTFTVTAALQGALTITSVTNGVLTAGALAPTDTFTITTRGVAVTSVATVTNTGTAPLTLGATAFLLNGTGLFSLPTTAGSNTCSTTPATTLPIGGTCHISITYATPATLPTAANTASIVIANNGSSALFGFNGLSLSGR